MTVLTPRSPLINWSEGFERIWNGNPASTHAFNALSFMLPQGEHFFIKVVKEVSEEHKDTLSEAIKENIRTFVYQEATHTNQHKLYNENLENQGYENVTFNYVEFLIKIAHKYLSSTHKLAIVCAYEHYTAILGNYLLTNPEALSSAPKEMSLMWEWHAAEETEHKAVCFDLYKSIGGSWLRRSLVFILVSIDFLLVFSRIYLHMLWRDGALNIKVLPKTILQTVTFFWGSKGVGWHLLFDSIKYFSPSFHPWNQNNKPLLKAWFIKNSQYIKEIKIK